MSAIIAITDSAEANETSSVTSSVLMRKKEEPTSPHDQKHDIPRTQIRAKVFRPSFELKPISSEEKELINKAFGLISDSLDTNLYAAERSNNFDEWKELLNILSRIVENFTNNHRKILGCLITSTTNKDISDFFHNKGLNTFQDATNALRSPRITKTECKRKISDMLKLKANAMIPLYMDDVNINKERELEILLEKLIKKSRY